MKKIFSKIAFLIVATYIVVSLVASNHIARSNPNKDTDNAENCLVNRLSNKKCLTQPQSQNSPTAAPSAIPNLTLTSKERFRAALTERLAQVPEPNSYEYILLRAYGAPFVNLESTIKLPRKLVFSNHKETIDFQDSLTIGKVIDTRNCYLQQSAADALNKARSQVKFRLKSGRGQSDCIRDFDTTKRFWKKYTNSRTLDLVKKGKETRILGTVAPPGASQHLWGLAIDLRVNNRKQIAALNKNGWYRTVEYDIPHWSYIGYPQEKLLKLGFQKKVVRGITYWVTPL